MINRRVAKKHETTKNVPGTSPGVGGGGGNTTIVGRDPSRRNAVGSPNANKNLSSATTPSPSSYQQQKQQHQRCRQMDSTPDTTTSSGGNNRNHGSTRKQQQLQKLRDQKLSEKKTIPHKRCLAQDNVRCTAVGNDVNMIGRNSERNPTTPPYVERPVRRNLSMDSPPTDPRYKTRIPLPPRTSMSPRVQQILASTPFSRKKQKVESKVNGSQQLDESSSSNISEAITAPQVFSFDDDNDDEKISDLPLITNNSVHDKNIYDESFHSSNNFSCSLSRSVLHNENDDVSSLGMDDSESTAVIQIHQKSPEPLIYKAQSDPTSNLMSLRARRDAKLKYFKNVMTIAKARNEDEKQKVNEQDASSVGTENSSPDSEDDDDDSIVRSDAKINSLVEALSVLKQQNLSKTASLTQKLDQLIGNL